MTRKEMVIEVLKGAFIAKPGGVMRVKNIAEIRNKDLYELAYDLIKNIFDVKQEMVKDYDNKR